MVQPITRWASAIALAGALVLDATDGRLARSQGTSSALGRWLDTMLDETGEMLLHAAIAVTAAWRFESPVWLGVGMLYGMGKYLFVLSNDEWNRATEDAEAGRPKPVKMPMDAEPNWSSPVWWFRRLGHADLRWHLWIGTALIGRLEWALAVYAAYFPARAVAGAFRKVRRSWQTEPGSQP